MKTYQIRISNKFKKLKNLQTIVSFTNEKIPGGNKVTFFPPGDIPSKNGEIKHLLRYCVRFNTKLIISPELDLYFRENNLYTPGESVLRTRYKHLKGETNPYDIKATCVSNYEAICTFPDVPLSFDYWNIFIHRDSSSPGKTSVTDGKIIKVFTGRMKESSGDSCMIIIKIVIQATIITIFLQRIYDWRVEPALYKSEVVKDNRKVWSTLYNMFDKYKIELLNPNLELFIEKW